jgi:hypothetical protein
MKRTPALTVAALAVAITFGAAACGDDGPEESDDSDTTDTTDATDTTETTEASETTETTEADTTEAPGSTDAPGNTAEMPEAGGEPTVETATPVLVGLTEDEATEAAEALGWEVRVIRRDGEDLPMTMDLRTNRVNVEVTDGEVTEVLQIG